jgi:hypothetical protein
MAARMLVRGIDNILREGMAFDVGAPTPAVAAIG